MRYRRCDVGRFLQHRQFIRSVVVIKIDAATRPAGYGHPSTRLAREECLLIPSVYGRYPVHIIYNRLCSEALRASAHKGISWLVCIIRYPARPTVFGCSACESHSTSQSSHYSSTATRAAEVLNPPLLLRAQSRLHAEHSRWMISAVTAPPALAAVVGRGGHSTGHGNPLPTLSSPNQSHPHSVQGEPGPPKDGGARSF